MPRMMPIAAARAALSERPSEPLSVKRVSVPSSPIVPNRIYLTCDARPIFLTPPHDHQRLAAVGGLESRAQGMRASLAPR
jgi:hypothetical protein